MGKSWVIAGICHELSKLDPDAKIIIFAPSKEILEQNAEKLELYGFDDIKVYSASCGRKEVGQYTMATIGSVKNHPELFKGTKYCIIDECFVAGTKVDGKNIEDIKVGDYVSSYNHTTGKVENKRVKRVIKKPSPNKLYCINTQSGSIISTGNHEYFTQRGYVRADNIVEGDVVYEASLHDKEIRNRKNLPNMQKDCSDKRNERISKELSIWGSTWENVVLQQRMRGNIEEEQDAQSANGTARTRVHQRDEAKGLPNEKNEWNGQAHMGKKPVKSISKRRKWETTNYSTEDSIGETGARMGCGTTNPNSGAKGKQGVSNMLQGRHRQSMADASDRARRTNTQESNSKEKGRQENCEIKPVRVDSVKTVERKSYGQLGLSDGGDYVYCITVEGNHNFFANEVLVHNCDQFKIDASGMYLKFFEQVGITRYIGLTATPYKQRQKYCKQGKFLEYTTSVSLLNRFPPIKGKYNPQFAWGKILYKIEMKDLQDMGYLCPIKYYTEMPQATLRLNSTGGDYAKADIEEFGIQSWNRILTVVTRLVRAKNPKRVLVFAPSVKASQSVSQALIERGISADHVDGKTPKKERSKKIARFRSGETQVMCNCQCLTAGFDLPALDTIVYAMPTLSPSRWQQSVGRCARIDPDNPNKVSEVYDLVGCCLTMGRPETFRIVKEDGFKDMLISERGRIDNVPLATFRIPLQKKQKLDEEYTIWKRD